MSGSVGSEEGDLGFQIAPMVDVVFVLMLFFMASAGSQFVEKELNISLPGLPSGAPPTSIGNTPTPIMIDISAEGQVVGNDQSLGAPTDRTLNPLRDWLKNTRSFGSEDPVIIRPNARTRHERIVEVLDACFAAGVKKLTFS